MASGFENPNRDRLHSSPNVSFSFERLSQTPKTLNDDQLYLVRAGGGNVIVFDMREFLPPFMSLNWTEYSSATEELPLRLPREYRKLADHFRTQWNEKTLLRALHFCGAFSSLVARISKSASRYVTGPSGPMMSRFPFWMKRNGVRHKNSRQLIPFIYEGVVDLDESLYPQDTNLVLPIEAKLQHFHDLSWHKLAFPCFRYIHQPHFENYQAKASSNLSPAQATRSRICRQ